MISSFNMPRDFACTVPPTASPATTTKEVRVGSISHHDQARSQREAQDATFNRPQHWDNKRPKSIVKISHSKERKSVQFSFTEVRIFPQILGDNPYCSNGLPLSLDWTYISKYSVPVGEYGFERVLQTSRVTRLDACRRKEILQQSSINENTASYNDSIIEILGGDNCTKTSSESQCKRTYSEPELKRAERRMFRQRMSASRKAVRGFFDIPTVVVDRN